MPLLVIHTGEIKGWFLSLFNYNLIIHTMMSDVNLSSGGSREYSIKEGSKKNENCTASFMTYFFLDVDNLLKL